LRDRKAKKSNGKKQHFEQKKRSVVNNRLFWLKCYNRRKEGENNEKTPYRNTGFPVYVAFQRNAGGSFISCPVRDVSAKA